MYSLVIIFFLSRCSRCCCQMEQQLESTLRYIFWSRLYLATILSGRRRREQGEICASSFVNLKAPLKILRIVPRISWIGLPASLEGKNHHDAKCKPHDDVLKTFTATVVAFTRSLIKAADGLAKKLCTLEIWREGPHQRLACLLSAGLVVKTQGKK